jgi:hypothetical protein
MEAFVIVLCVAFYLFLVWLLGARAAHERARERGEGR